MPSIQPRSLDFGDIFLLARLETIVPWLSGSDSSNDSRMASPNSGCGARRAKVAGYSPSSTIM
jgi:hypothetical protein